jgi:hypothetical protein
MLNAGLKPACGELIEMARLVWEREAPRKNSCVFLSFRGRANWPDNWPVKARRPPWNYALKLLRSLAIAMINLRK